MSWWALAIAWTTLRRSYLEESSSASQSQSLCLTTPLLLADEPTGELDDNTAAEILDLLGSINEEMGTTILIVTHDPDIAYKVGRVVMIRDGKMATEIRRKVTFHRLSSVPDTDQLLEEFILVDGSGRVQIPRDVLDELSIGNRARLRIEDGKVTIVPVD